MRRYPFGRLAGPAALAVALAVATPALAGTTDAWGTTKVKMALLTSDGVSSTAVNVDTIDGRVTLHGTVGSAAEKDAATRAMTSPSRSAQALTIARSTAGVRAVVDGLRVESDRHAAR